MKLLASLKTTNIICNNLPAAAKRHQTLEFLRETFNWYNGITKVWKKSFESTRLQTNKNFRSPQMLPLAIYCSLLELTDPIVTIHFHHL